MINWWAQLKKPPSARKLKAVGKQLTEIRLLPSLLISLEDITNVKNYMYNTSHETWIWFMRCYVLLWFCTCQVYPYPSGLLYPVRVKPSWKTWWYHQMGTFSALLALCAGNSPVTGEFPTQRPVMRSFDVFFDLHLNKRLRKQLWGWWFEKLSSPLWRHCNDVSK